jgi:hypothetical protein
MLKGPTGDLAVNCQAGPNRVINLTGLSVPSAEGLTGAFDPKHTRAAQFCWNAQDRFFQRCGRV